MCLIFFLLVSQGSTQQKFIAEPYHNVYNILRQKDFWERGMISQNAAGPGDVCRKRESAILILVHCICCLVPTYLFNLIFSLIQHKNTFAPNNVK